MAIRIIVDSSADMEEGYARAHDITIIPMTIAFGSEQYAEGVDLSREEFFERLVETDDLPRTSQIPPMVFKDLFQEAVDAGDEVVCITLSSHISGTYQSACIAAAPFKESVFVVDSENATIGERILAERAWALRDEGLSAADIAYCLNQEKKDIRLVASLDTLEYLRRGGRIPSSVAYAGSKLDVKPLLTITVDGKLSLAGVARGRKKGIKQLAEYYNKRKADSRPGRCVVIGNADCPKDAARLQEALGKGDDSILFLGSSIGPVIGSHVGPDMIAVVFWGNDKREELSVADRIAKKVKGGE